MKRSIIQVKNANVRIESTETGLTKISVSENFCLHSKEPKWIFYLPQSTREHFGFVPDKIIKSRMMHDFDVNLLSYTVTLLK